MGPILNKWNCCMTSIAVNVANRTRTLGYRFAQLHHGQQTCVTRQSSTWQARLWPNYWHARRISSKTILKKASRQRRSRSDNILKVNACIASIVRCGWMAQLNLRTMKTGKNHKRNIQGTDLMQMMWRLSNVLAAKIELVLNMKSISVNDRTVVLTIGHRPHASAQPGDAATGFPCDHRPCTWGLLLNQFVVRVCSAL